MPTVKPQGRETGHETSLAKVGPRNKGSAARRQLSRLPMTGRDTSRMPPKSETSVAASGDGVHTPVSSGSGLTTTKIACSVPVIGPDRTPLMPTTAARARRWMRSGKATPFWSKGIFCVRLNTEPSSRVVQPVAVGIDPGSKKEGFSVTSKVHTYLNLQADAVTWVSDAVATRRAMRRARRFRKTPCRQPRANCACGGLPPRCQAARRDPEEPSAEEGFRWLPRVRPRRRERALPQASQGRLRRRREGRGILQPHVPAPLQLGTALLVLPPDVIHRLMIAA